MQLPRSLPAAILCATLASCVTAYEAIPIHFSTAPPGADVVVDGVPSGFATPCMISLQRQRQVITLEKAGYQVSARVLFPDPYNDTWFWSEGSVGPHTYPFPIFINLDDFLQPVVAKNELMPARVFVRLRRLMDEEGHGE